MAEYFGSIEDESIKKYLEAEDVLEKNRIFEQEIMPAFEKLVENLIYVYKFFNIDDVETLKKDCLTNLYEMLPKFDPSKGSKGFSYFNVVAKNWLIQKQREKVKKFNNERDLYVDIDKESIKQNYALVYEHEEKKMLEKEHWLSFFSELEQWRDKMIKKNERKMLEAVIFLIKNSELINIYNKKAIYLYLKEITGLNEKQVAISLKKMKEHYVKWKVKYHQED